MVTQLKLGDIAEDVVFKDIKNVHLTVYPPTGRVKMSAPRRMSLNPIRVFAVSKLDWIKKQQMKLREQQRETPREFLNRESHYVWGKRYLLKVVECDGAPSIELTHDQMLLCLRPGADSKKAQMVANEWYRDQIRQAASSLIPQVGIGDGRAGGAALCAPDED